nr:hypothetical protein [Tanacetum cinerariifolium]
MASEQSSSGPALNEMTPATISSGLVQKSSSSTLYVPPSRNDWDFLFQPMFDELLNPPPSIDPQAPKVIAPITEVIPLVQAESTGSPSSTSVDQDAPSPNRLKSLGGNVKEEKIKRELEEIEMINIELDHRVTKLVAENEHLKQTYKQLTAHTDYLRHTQEETASLREIVERTKLMAVTPKNNDKKIRLTKHIPLSGNTPTKTTSSTNIVSNTTVLSSTGVNLLSSASRSQPQDNTKNDRIQRPPSKAKKNKLEDYHRTVRPSLNKKKSVVDTKAISSVTNSKLNVNADLKCATRQRPNPGFGIAVSHLNFGAINHLARHGLVRDFDELTAMAPEQSSLGPALNEMIPATISSGLMQKYSSSTPYVPPSRNDWDLLFQPIFDELLNPPPSVDPQAPKVIAPIIDVIPPV